MAAYYGQFDVTNVTSYTTLPNFTLTFTPTSTLVVNEHAAAIVQVSFDGVSDAGNLVGGISPSVEWGQRYTQIWVKRTAGVIVGAATVSVMAEDWPRAQ